MISKKEQAKFLAEAMPYIKNYNDIQTIRRGAQKGLMIDGQVNYSILMRTSNENIGVMFICGD